MSDDFEPTLNFRPINEGLGFHPFSDGLPYAPVTPQAKSARTSPNVHPQRVPGVLEAQVPAGAVLAGVPRTATAAVLRDSKSTVRTTAPRLRSADFEQKEAVAPSVALEIDAGWSVLFKRVLAFALDIGFSSSFCALAIGIGLARKQIDFQQMLSPEFVLVAAIMLMTFAWVFVVAQEVALGSSVGKRLMGLRLQGSMSAILMRAILFLPSAGLFGMGLLWSLFDSRRRCWHDLASGVVLSESASL